MEEIAVLLKQARENKGVSLQEVQTATRIPMHYLEVLEGARDTSFLADRLYLIPFLRNYATFLNISPETAVAQFVGELQRIEASADRSEQPRELFRFSPWLVLLSLVIASLVIISFVWHRGKIDFLWQWAKQEPPSLSADGPSSPLTEPTISPSSTPSLPSELSSSPSTEPSAPSAAASPLSSEPPSSPLIEPSASSSSTPLFAVEAGAPETPLLAPNPQPLALSQEALYLLSVRATERTWIHATIDGEQERDVLLQPGEKVEWSAQEGFVLTVGNAGGTELTFNGKDLPTLGGSGEVIRDLQLPPAEEEERG